ncbi:hypothetical protein Tco_1207394, partial [Tanacetum coccineum]
MAATSEVPIEQQTDLSPRPSPTTIIPDSIPETSGGNLGGPSSSDKSLSGNEGDMTLQIFVSLYVHSMAEKCLIEAKIDKKLKKQKVHKESVSKQGRKFAKGESSVSRDPLFDEIPEDTVDHMETENAQDEGRTRDIVDGDKEIEENVLSTDKDKVSTDMEKVSTDRPIVSTDGFKVSTDRQNESTEEHNESTEEHNESTEEHIEGTEEHNEGTEEHIEGTKGQNEGTKEHNEGTEEHIEGTEEHNEGTEEHNEGTEEQFKSTDGQRKGTEDH